ncbi:ankyrin homolog [Littorina saxatilis]|uniref:SOCS box domain-containing protein n=1 Tax=Littorina saxatilis TaxID=31220 RepID=A0AAN9BLT0_9CAEN
MAECVGRRSKKKKNGNTDQQEEADSSPEHEAEVVTFSDKEILKFLIAAQSEDVETLEYYLESGMPVDTECLMFSDTALFKACRTGSVEAARLLLHWGANMGKSTDSGETALHIAVKNRQPGILNLLFSHGASPDVKALHEQITPLMIAASMSNTTILKLLIAAGSNLDLRDASGMCALHYCFNYYQERPQFVTHSVDCVKLLVAAGANLHIRDSLGKFPLTRAIEKLNMRGIKFFLAQNCEPNYQLTRSQLVKRLPPVAFALSIGNLRLANLLWLAGSSCDGAFSAYAANIPWRKDLNMKMCAFYQPRSLKEASRKTVRDELRACGGVGQKLYEIVEELCIPTTLKDFLLLKDLL